jgi:formylmethanofuran dehydrogenase subunit B
MHSEGAVRNTLTLQNSGWQNTTLAEVKNRATLILAIGMDIVTSHPRFFERLVWNKESMFDKTSPEVIYLGESLANTEAGISPDGKKPTVISADNAKLPEILNALHGLMNSKNPLSKRADEDLIGGVPVSTLRSIIDKIKAAQYTVVIWAAGAFNYPNAELTIQSITQLIAKFNETVRIAGLPLNAGDGDLSANNACTWLNGYPIRSRFNHGQMEYNVRQFATKEQLKTCDALLWTSTFNPHLPPSCNAPTIVIGHPNMKFERAPDVFIPVGIPGVDHAGTIIRMDNVVSLPLKKLRESALPSLSQVIQQIMDQLS